jgi:hypothetical protein
MSKLKKPSESLEVGDITEIAGVLYDCVEMPNQIGDSCRYCDINPLAHNPEVNCSTIECWKVILKKKV